MYNYSLTSVQDAGQWSRPRSGRFIAGTHCIGGWVGPKAGLDGCGNLPPTPPPPEFDPRTVQLVASRETERSRPTKNNRYFTQTHMYI